MRSITKNKKGQLDNPVILFVVLIAGLILFAPIALKVFVNVDTSVGNSLGNLSGQQGVIAQQNFKAVTTPLISFWDKVIISAFVLAVLLLFVSAFLIDAHPFFVVLYIFINFMLILFIPSITKAIDHIYDSANFATEVAQLTFLDTLRQNFTVFVIGIMIITGIIIYGKLAFFQRSNNRR